MLTSIACTPILDSLVRNYTHLENVRQVIHRDETKSVFLEKSPRALNYKESINVFLKEYQLVEDWIVNSFKEFAMFPSDQKVGTCDVTYTTRKLKSR